ncbi:isopenicillin N synthase family dioxygenase [Sphingomonas adhaesiva]|uniref:isopenicillin N synthase family dioxygenase n=1 Tax=Sphingomonas adhaesiva TaxID=28212 RepID=UPI002FF81F8E
MNDPAALPIVDISDLAGSSVADRLAVAHALDDACRRSGFLYIRGAQLDWRLADRLLATAKRYFAQGMAAKMAHYIGGSSNHSGYVPAGEEEFGGGTRDLKEAYDVNNDYPHAEGRRPLLGPNLWPDLPGFRDDVLAYYRHLDAIGRQLFGAFACALGLAEDHFAPHLRHPPNQLRLIHYPLAPAAEDRPGIGAHTDYECFTLLFATSGGLQVMDRSGEWRDVPPVDGTMVMNIGDMMELMSNGRWLATTHRVKKVAEERYSFPLFFTCDYDHVVAPLVPPHGARRYAPIRCGEHLFHQTAQTFAYLKQRQARGEVTLAQPLPLGSFGVQA